MSDRRRGAAAALAALVAACASGLAWTAVPIPQRICSVSLAGDEMLHLLVNPDRVVCVSSFADDREMSNVAGVYPKTIPRLAARIEPVLATRPDLVVAAPWNSETFSDLLAKTGVSSYVLPDVHDFAQIRAAVLVLGGLVGAPDRAAAAAREMDRRLAELDERIANVPERPRVLSFSHLIVAGAETTVDALIRRAGGRNAVAEAGVTGHRQIPMEEILALDPDWLLLGFDPGESADRLLDAYPLLKKTRAAREGHVIVLAPRLLTTVSPYLVDGAERLAFSLHPGQFGPGRGGRP